MTDTDAILMRLAQAVNDAPWIDANGINHTARALGDSGLRRLLEACEPCCYHSDHRSREVSAALDALKPAGAAIPTSLTGEHNSALEMPPNRVNQAGAASAVCSRCGASLVYQHYGCSDVLAAPWVTPELRAAVAERLRRVIENAEDRCRNAALERLINNATFCANSIRALLTKLEPWRGET